MSPGAGRAIQNPPSTKPDLIDTVVTLLLSRNYTATGKPCRALTMRAPRADVPTALP